MRKIREVLRLHFELGCTHRQIAAACSVSPATVSDYLTRALRAGLGWQQAQLLSEAEVEAKLFVHIGRSEPEVRRRVEQSLQACVDAITRTIAADTGVNEDEAELLSVGLCGLAEVGARWWLGSGGTVSKERAVELLVSLAWRGIAGSPRRSVPDSGSAR